MDKKILKRINQWIKEVQRDPFKDLGNPEPLRNELSGFWSGRINQEHRLVYRLADDGQLYILKCRYHY